MSKPDVISVPGGFAANLDMPVKTSVPPVYSDNLPKKYCALSLDELATPKEGRVVMLDRWWNITADGYALFTMVEEKRVSPNCNHNASISSRLCPAGCECELVPVAYVPTHIDPAMKFAQVS